MSEFSDKYKTRVANLSQYMLGLIAGEKGTDLIEKYQILETTFIPLDVIMALDEVLKKESDMEKIKSASNKFFNMLFKNLEAFEKYDYPNTHFLYYLIKDNQGLKTHIKNSRQLIKDINKQFKKDLVEDLKESFNEMLRFTEHYTLLQNVLFPEIENKFEQHACLKILWSFHDDIVRNIKTTLDLLNEQAFDIVAFNKISSKVYFNINTVLFREESVLFPIAYEKIETEIFRKMLNQVAEFKLEYVDTKKIEVKDNVSETGNNIDGLIKLSTGILNLEQLELIFNHLPVDMTYVDENDKVKFYSDPKHRIFPRTVSIIGRNVENCHPQESVHIVSQIVEAFKNGEKDEASFWIKMGPKYVLIKYFAVRDNEHNYKGVLEVSQEISDIKKIEGERRLLDW